MNRCPICQSVFTFEGIQTRGPNKTQTWRHWDRCDRCMRWYVHDEHGMPVFDTATKPGDGVFGSW